MKKMHCCSIRRSSAEQNPFEDLFSKPDMGDPAPTPGGGGVSGGY